VERTRRQDCPLLIRLSSSALRVHASLLEDICVLG
jgi:hypothetical protein